MLYQITLKGHVSWTHLLCTAMYDTMYSLNVYYLQSQVDPPLWAKVYSQCAFRLVSNIFAFENIFCFLKHILIKLMTTQTCSMMWLFSCYCSHCIILAQSHHCSYCIYIYLSLITSHRLLCQCRVQRYQFIYPYVLFSTYCVTREFTWVIEIILVHKYIHNSNK